MHARRLADRMTRIRRLRPLGWVAFLVAVGGCGQSTGQAAAHGTAATDQGAGQWSTHGRDAGLTYFSPLSDIDTSNVHRLGFAWEYRLATNRGLEATPIVVNGVMYTSGPWGLVYALNAATGQEIWTFDPHNDTSRGRYACCDFVNRGVEIFKGRVYVASFDGRLFSLDGKTGRKIWETDTIVDRRLPYTSTGAPQVAGDVVVIGNAGGDVGTGAVRGYVSALDLETGHLRWRFYTVPACEATSQDVDQQRARETWPADCSLRAPGGGTVWDGLAYDEKLKLVYIGTGNAAPYYRRTKGKGRVYDNLYVSSIVALNASTGHVAWYYQTTPGDMWDYDATAKMVLADLTIHGRRRSVLMQAAKNGFFYVIDRRTGEVLSAKPYAEQNWALGMDKKFRPIPSPAVDYGDSPKLVVPSTAGAHTSAPMSFNRVTGLVYIPVLEAQNILVNLETNPGALVKHLDGGFATAFVPFDDAYHKEDYTPILGPLPDVSPRPILRNVLRAWDPIAQRVVWEQETWRGLAVFPGGVMSTAANLVFQGNVDGRLTVLEASTGRLLKSIDTGSAIVTAPMTYRINGIQYVAVMAGWGGSMMSMTFPKGSAPYSYQNIGRILAFRLDGSTETPKPEPRIESPITQPETVPPRDAVERGQRLFIVNCGRCHGQGPALNPDLTRPTFGSEDPQVFRSIVLNGALVTGGMGRFDDTLSRADVDDIYAYITDVRWQQFKAERLKTSPAQK